MVKEQVTKEVLSQQLANAGVILMNMSRDILMDKDKKEQQIYNFESVQIHLETGVVSFLTEVHNG